MAEITNYSPSQVTDAATASKIASWQNTKYPVRLQSQVLTAQNVSDVKKLTLDNLEGAAALLDKVVTECTAAKNNSGTDNFSLVDESGTELNTLPEDLDAISSMAETLAENIRGLRTSIDTNVDTWKTNDEYALSAWKNSEDYKKEQEEKNSGSV